MDGETRTVATMAFGPSPGESARLIGLTRSQTLSLAATVALAGVLTSIAPDLALGVATWIAWSAYGCIAVWRGFSVVLSLTPTLGAPRPRRWPRYTIAAPLRGERAVVAQLVERLSAIDYPRDRLEGFLVVDADDADTLDAVRALNLPPWLRLLVAPEATPATKPRALNVALAQAKGELITVYDAEDDPDPLQLREAAARFMAGSRRLACLQAPLRIRARAKGPHAAPFLDPQFAAEYAAHFEVTLPALARLGWPFPLGGTSNHFRVDVLRDVGGWDPWNVTEDADLSFRLWRRGYRLGMLRRPTYEPPPGDLSLWLPQRTRWLKGHMQTWGVHMRAPWGLGWRGLLALQLTLGQGVASAMFHAPALAWAVWLVLLMMATGMTPIAPIAAVVTILAGTATAWLTCAVACHRIGLPYPPSVVLAAPLYWALQSLAFAHAAFRLVTQPFAWDKTPHHADSVEAEPAQDWTQARVSA